MKPCSPLAPFSFALLFAFSCAAQNAALPAAQSPKPDPSMLPIQDAPGLPRVLLIGDSISIGYTLPVRERLKGKANVHRILTNGGPTINGLKNLSDWLGAGHWDVIHFNWGLHDLKFMENGRHQVGIEDYEKNLRALVKELRPTGARLIWCSTTPVPDAKVNPPRKNSDVLAFNAAAKKVMNENQIAIDDLYSWADKDLSRIQLRANVHYTKEGYEYLAREVAMSIEAALPKL